MTDVCMPEFELPEEATPASYYEYYRANNNPEPDRFDELRKFYHWLELNGIFCSISEAAEGMEAY